MVALVDDSDYVAVSEFKWRAQKGGRSFYAARSLPRVLGKAPTLLLHQFLVPSSEQVDHRDGNGLNNQRENLRPATAVQNAQSFRRKKAETTSRFRGVNWDSPRRKWAAFIRVNGKNLFLGRFGVEEQAARAYDKAAREHFGEFASPNFST